MRHYVRHALDGVNRFGDPERATVGDSSRRLVGVNAVHFHMRGLEVIRAGADVKETGRKLGWVRGGISIAVVRDRLDPQAGQGAVPFARQFSADVIIAGKGIRLKIFHPVLDPLHRLAGQNRGRNGDHVAGVNRHLAAEAAADIRRDDPDLLFGKPHVSRHQGKDGADGVRRLGRHPNGQLPAHLVEGSDATTGLDGRDMDARQVNVLLDCHFGFLENFVGCRLIANFPVPDVIVFFIFLVGAKHRRPAPKP